MSTTLPADTATDLTPVLFNALARCVKEPARRPSDNPAAAPALSADAVEFVDRTLAALTAFPNYATFVRSARTGYAPSIYADTRRGRSLARVLVAAGWPVFDGRRTVWPARNHADSPYRA